MSTQDVVVPETLVLLHGFGATRRTWDRVIAHLDPQRYRPLALDLPGHGERPRPEGPIAFESCMEAVLAASPKCFALCGYSMGGRIALQIALAAPERLTRLIVVASSPGIEAAGERAQRRVADYALADELERLPFERFIDRWSKQALFSDDPAGVQALAQEDQRRNDPRLLAAVMRRLGTGAMAPLWSRLGDLKMPVTILVGDRDTRYRALSEQMLDLLPDGALAVVPGGHRLPLESPRSLARELSGMSRLGSTEPRETSLTPEDGSILKARNRPSRAEKPRIP